MDGFLKYSHNYIYHSIYHELASLITMLEISFSLIVTCMQYYKHQNIYTDNNYVNDNMQVNLKISLILIIVILEYYNAVILHNYTSV